MCGITAIYGYRADAPEVELDELRSIRDHMARRGPDGAGEWLSPDRRVGLGHRRLAIIDLSERGAQLMIAPDSSLSIVFDGEIYNCERTRIAVGRGGWRLGWWSGSGRQPSLIRRCIDRPSTWWIAVCLLLAASTVWARHHMLDDAFIHVRYV